MSYRAMNQYKQNSISTASPEELTLMLYNGAIKFMNISKLGIEEGDIQKKNESLIRAQNIINELKHTLNMDYEISEEMSRLYDFILEKLIDANINKDVQAVDDALTIVYEMRDTWADVIKQLKNPAYKAE